ncbi:MAG TPA: hypothetical protein VLL97_01100 [Acidobacteriota bacterium]|nr:hypothetical protein [Acidobacteriota bacterium]
MRKMYLTAALVAVLGIILTGCASAPTQEIEATKTALSAVQTDDVKEYAPESLLAAEEEMNRALAELQTQEAKSAFSRDFKQVSEMLISTKSLAEKALADAEAAKAKAKADAEVLIAELPFIIEEAKTALAKAPRGKGTKADLEAMQNDLNLAEESRLQAVDAVAQQNYKDALVKANSAKEKASMVTSQIQAALDKTAAGRARN